MTKNEAAALADHLEYVARDLDSLLAELHITGALGSRERLELTRLSSGLPTVITFLTARARNLRGAPLPQEATP